jgi:hypothetical protein
MIQAALRYFGVVFSVAFVTGTIRQLWVVPRLGTRTAELLELPLIVALSFVTARWILRRHPAASNRFRLGMGSIALLFMLIAEFGFVLALRGMTIAEYMATRDPVSGPAYYLALLVFGAMPFLTGR